MAAVIARISRQNRERKLRLREELPTSKSNYVLVPFDKNFVPSRDNNVSYKISYKIINGSVQLFNVDNKLAYNSHNSHI